MSIHRTLNTLYSASNPVMYSEVTPFIDTLHFHILGFAGGHMVSACGRSSVMVSLQKY